MLDYKVDANRNACQSSAMYDACQHVCTNKVFEVTVMKHRRDQSEMLARRSKCKCAFSSVAPASAFVQYLPGEALLE